MAAAPFIYCRPSDDGTGACVEPFLPVSLWNCSCVWSPEFAPLSFSLPGLVSNADRACRGFVFAVQGALLRAAFDGNLGRLKGTSLRAAVKFPLFGSVI